MIEVAPVGADLRDRVIWVIDEFVGAWRKYQYLEQRTGISARKWQNVYNRVQQPSIEMIAALAEYRPYFLAWMVTGRGISSAQLDPTKADWMEQVLRHSAQELGISRNSKGGAESAPKNSSHRQQKGSERSGAASADGESLGVKGRLPLGKR